VLPYRRPAYTDPAEGEGMLTAQKDLLFKQIQAQIVARGYPPPRDDAVIWVIVEAILQYLDARPPIAPPGGGPCVWP
jgi:hypothetical protein